MPGAGDVDRCLVAEKEDLFHHAGTLALGKFDLGQSGRAGQGMGDRVQSHVTGDPPEKVDVGLYGEAILGVCVKALPVPPRFRKARCHFARSVHVLTE